MLSYTIPLGKSKGGIIQGKPKLALRGWKWKNLKLENYYQADY
jgi:hypothetical protein